MVFKEDRLKKILYCLEHPRYSNAGAWGCATVLLFLSVFISFAYDPAAVIVAAVALVFVARTAYKRYGFDTTSKLVIDGTNITLTITKGREIATIRLLEFHRGVEYFPKDGIIVILGPADYGNGVTLYGIRTTNTYDKDLIKYFKTSGISVSRQNGRFRDKYG